MSTKADIIDLIDNATEDSLEKILAATKEILQAEKGDTVYTIEEIKNKSVPIAKKYGVKKLSLFGSYARGEADGKSDVDFLIEKGDISGLGYISFVLDLEDEFGCHVDVVTTGISDKNFLSAIQSEQVMLYEE